MKKLLLCFTLVALSANCFAEVTVNGKTYSGNNVMVINGDVYVDGKLVDQKKDSEKIVIHGNVANLNTDQSVEVKGMVTGDVKAGGSVNGNDIGGDVDAGGSVNAASIQGKVTAKGSVNCHP